MNLNRLAFLISRIFDFYFWFPVMIFVTVFNTGLTPDQIRLLLPTILALDAVLPICLFFLILKNRGVSDIDVTKRSQRPKLFGTMTFILSVSTFISFFLANYLFFVLHFISLLVTLTLYLITLRFKISGHMIMNVGAIFIINYLFGWQLLWLFSIIPFIGFARIHLKKHTFGEVLVGAVVGFLEPLLILWGVGLL